MQEVERADSILRALAEVEEDLPSRAWEAEGAEGVEEEASCIAIDALAQKPPKVLCFWEQNTVAEFMRTYKSKHNTVTRRYAPFTLEVESNYKSERSREVNRRASPLH